MIFNQSESHTIEIDSWLPRYKQLAREIATYIKERQLPPGSKLPGGRVFASKFNASKNTVFEALDLLQSENIIEIRKGSGSYVTDESSMDFDKGAINWNNYISGGWQATVSPTLSSLARAASGGSKIYMGLACLHKDFGYNDIFIKSAEKVLADTSSSDILSSYDVQGRQSFRNLISERLLSGGGIRASASNIIITWGLMGSIDLLIKALLGRGDTIYTESSSSIISMTLAGSIGVNVVEVSTDNERISISEIKRKMKRSKRAVIIVSPSGGGHTDTVMSETQKKELLELSASANIPIIELDASGGPVLHEYKPLKALDTDNRVIYVGSILLPYSLGLDISWVAAPDHITDKIIDISTQSCHYPFNLNNLIVEKMLSDNSYDKFIKEVKPKIVERIKLTNELLIKYLPDSAAVWDKDYPKTLFCIKIHKDINTPKILKNAEEQGVVFIPGDMYNRSYTSYIYLFPFALSPEELEHGISILGNLLKNAIK